MKKKINKNSRKKTDSGSNKFSNCKASMMIKLQIYFIEYTISLHSSDKILKFDCFNPNELELNRVINSPTVLES